MVILGTRDCAADSAISNLRSLKASGKAQHEAFVKEVLEDGTRSTHEPFKKNSLTIFKENKKSFSKLAFKTKSLGNDISLRTNVCCHTASRWRHE